MCPVQGYLTLEDSLPANGLEPGCTHLSLYSGAISVSVSLARALSLPRRHRRRRRARALSEDPRIADNPAGTARVSRIKNSHPLMALQSTYT